jgi:uncharacterized protein
MRQPPILVVMARAPVCGAVKTRLAMEIGVVRATALHRLLTARLLREVTRDPRFRTVLAVSPDLAVHARFPAWMQQSPRRGPPMRIKQGKGGLGERMQRIFNRCGRGPLIIVGTDIPFVTAAMIADAFRKFASADAVFGPAEDGGYWLVGLRRRPRCLAPFENVRWSSSHVLEDTIANLPACRIAFARTLYDVDTADNYRRFLRERCP